MPVFRVGRCASAAGRAGRSPGLLVLVALLVLSSGPLPAADPPDMMRARSDLGDVQRRIRLLEQAIAENEATHSEAERERARTERAVTAARRTLHDTAAALKEAEGALQEAETAHAEVAARIEQRQQELAAWTTRQYMGGASDMAPFLAARDPNQIARDLHYLEHLGRARLELIAALRADLDEQRRLAETIAARRDSLSALHAEQQQQASTLEQRLAEREQALTSLTAELGRQRQVVNALRQDEEQLGKVLEVLARRQAEREAARRRAEAQRAAEAAEAAERAAAERAAARPPQASDVPQPQERPRAVRATPDVRPAAQAPQGVSPTPAGMSFAQLQGRMRLPVPGELVARFGARRAEGGTPWRGVFIRARNGEDVLSVAPGEVVFSDWLRGYGNLIIIDHGSEYLTIYGYNDALYRNVGERIEAGVPIAGVGASGSMQESGLYFEVRHKGQPVDPLKWVRPR